MSDTLERFRNVERRDLEQGAHWGGGGASMVQVEGGDYVSSEDFTALLAVAEEREKILNALDATLSSTNEAVLRLEAKVEEQQKEIERLKDEMFTEQDIAEAYGAGRKEAEAAKAQLAEMGEYHEGYKEESQATLAKLLSRNLARNGGSGGGGEEVG